MADHPRGSDVPANGTDQCICGGRGDRFPDSDRACVCHGKRRNRACSCAVNPGGQDGVMTMPDCPVHNRSAAAMTSLPRGTTWAWRRCPRCNRTAYVPAGAFCTFHSRARVPMVTTALTSKQERS